MTNKVDTERPHEIVRCVKCGHDQRWLRKGICGYFSVPVSSLQPTCGCRCEFPAQGNEAKTQQRDPVELSKGFAGVRRHASDFAAARRNDAPPPDQHVAPRRMFIHAGANVETKPCGCGGDIEYIPATPVREALAECEPEPNQMDTLIILESDWQKLNEAINGTK